MRSFAEKKQEINLSDVDSEVIEMLDKAMMFIHKLKVKNSKELLNVIQENHEVVNLLNQISEKVKENVPKEEGLKEVGGGDKYGLHNHKCKKLTPAKIAKKTSEGHKMFDTIADCWIYKKKFIQNLNQQE